MADAAFFLRKKTRPRGPTLSRQTSAAGVAGPSRIGRPIPSPRSNTGVALTPTSSSSAAPSPASVKPENKDNIVEIQIVSAEPGSGTRYNLMKLNSLRDVDPSHLPRPILMNRKQPGPRAPPQFAHDEDGRIIGRYVYDEEGKPVLDAEGKPTVEKKDEIDLSLVGSAPGQSAKRKGKRGVREVFHQDIEVIRLRREEALPWVLESKNTSESPTVQDHWVGRMTEPSTLPTVLLVNEGHGASFTMVPLGRSYRFEPERPFKVMDPDQAHKYFEMQSKYKVHDRWSQRQDGVGGVTGLGNTGGPIPNSGDIVKAEVEGMRRLEDRAQRMEWQIRANRGDNMRTQPRRERFEDDDVRERRNIGRGLEGGIDEELDFDVNEEFQDDEDVNTFYRNEDEEEEQKLHEERQKREFRIANANVGDRPQIAGEDEDEDDLFGDIKLTSEGKRLRKMMRKQGRADDEGDLYESTDESDSDSEPEPTRDETGDKGKTAPPSAERPSRPPSRGPGDRAVGSPTRRLQPPTPDRANAAPPGSGSALLAQRAASRGASPRRSRAGSPLSARGNSPDALRGTSPTPGSGRAISPIAPPREGSPAIVSPANAAHGTSAAASPRPKSKSAKRKTTSESPLRESSTTALSSSVKRKSADSPTPSTPGSDGTGAAAAAGNVGGDPARKKKKRGPSSSATPGPEDGAAAAAAVSFPGMITRGEVLEWLRAQPEPVVPMGRAISAFAKQITAAGDNKGKNQQLFLHWIRTFTDKDEGKQLKMKPEFLL